MKLAFHAVVTNSHGNVVVNSIILNVGICFVIGSMSMYKYLQTTIPDCSRALKPIPIPPKGSSNVIPSLSDVQVTN